MKKLFLFILTLSIAAAGFAQGQPQNRKQSKEAQRKERKAKIENMIRQQEEGALVFNKQNVFGIRLNTDGWGLFFEKGYMKSVKVTNLFALEIGEKKDPKEKKQSLNQGFIQVGSPYAFGKQNIFYQVKPSFYQQRLIGGKTNRNGVAVQAIYGGGISVGLERPYYVTVVSGGSGNQTRDIKYTQADSALFLSANSIVQGTGFRYGWKDMKVVPGVHAKIAVRFDYGRFNEMVSAIEVGLNVEAYSRKIELMVLNPHNQVFFNSYVAILLGKRK